MIVVMAVLSQVVLFGIYYYLDARMITATSDADVWRISFHPLTIALYGLTPWVMWWSYRVVYRFLDQRFWLTILLEGVLLYLVHLLSSYWATRIMPTNMEWAGLVLSLLAVLVAAL